jgi:hypothetical protein
MPDYVNWSLCVTDEPARAAFHTARPVPTSEAERTRFALLSLAHPMARDRVLARCPLHSQRHTGLLRPHSRFSLDWMVLRPSLIGGEMKR